MSPLKLNLPEGAKFTNHLYASKEPGYLLEDLVIVELNNGRIIDAGWYPEHDKKGSYVIRVYSRDWSEQIGPTINAIEPNEVCRIIEFIAQFHSLDLVSCSDASSSSQSTHGLFSESGELFTDVQEFGGFTRYSIASYQCLSP